MKKIILLASVLALASCASLFNGSKKHEEFEYFSFNEKNKPSIRKPDIYMTKVTKIESLNSSIAEVNSKYDHKVKPVGSWEFSQKPSKTLKDEILNKAIELGANYVIMFEKKDCDTIDFKKGDFEALVGTNCYKMVYYYVPEATNVEPAPAPATHTAPTPTKVNAEKAIVPAPEPKAVLVPTVKE